MRGRSSRVEKRRMRPNTLDDDAVPEGVRHHSSAGGWSTGFRRDVGDGGGTWGLPVALFMTQRRRLPN